jgi:uncharacterized protein
MAIDFEGEFLVATPRAEAYAVLADPQQFAPLLPTYLSHEPRDDGTTDVKVKVGVGKIRGTAVVNLNLTENSPPDSASYEGKGHIMGGAFNLGAAFQLEEPSAGETRVKWRGDLVILGKLASMAGGLIRPIAKKQIQNLIDAIQNALETDGSTPASQQSS